MESSAGSYDAYRPGSSFTARATLPPHAKVMMLMKSNTPGEKPRLVKLEPVENPSKPDFRFAFETLRKCVKKSTPLQVPRTRKRRIIQPVVKKNKVLIPNCCVVPLVKLYSVDRPKISLLTFADILHVMDD